MTHGTLGQPWIDDQIRKADQMSEAPERIDEAATQASKNMAIWISDYGDAEANRLWDEYNDAIQAWARKNIEARSLYDAQAKVIEGMRKALRDISRESVKNAPNPDKINAMCDAALQESSHD